MTRAFTGGIATWVFVLSIAGAGAVHAQDKVSLKDAHRGTLDIDLALLNTGGRQPEEVLAFYQAARKALCGEQPQQALAEACRRFGRYCPTPIGNGISDHWELY